MQTQNTPGPWTAHGCTVYAGEWIVGNLATASELLHVYHATESVAVRIETDKADGFADVKFLNDAQAWTIGCDDSNDFRIRDVTGATTLVTVTPTYVNINEGLLYLNDTSSPSITQGILIDQGANDDHILDLQSSDVGHAITNFAEADTYGYFRKAANTAGGLMIVGLRADDASPINALHLRGFLDETAAQTT